MTNESQSKTMPTLFIPHGGGPCFFMDSNPPDTWKKMGAWLGELAGTIGVTPRAIVVVRPLGIAGVRGDWVSASATDL